MISIFNGSRRGLGKESPDVFIKLDVKLRDYINLFTNSTFKVFMTIALHANQDGFAYPSIQTLMKETGIGEEAIYSAVKQLLSMEINNERLIAKIAIKDNKGKRANNIYLLLPNREDFKKIADRTLYLDFSKYFPNSPEIYHIYWEGTPYTDEPYPVQPSMDEPSMVEPSADEPSAAEPGIKKKQIINKKQKEKEETTKLDSESPSADSVESENTDLAVIPDSNSGMDLPKYLTVPGKAGKMFPDMTLHEQLMHIYFCDIGGLTPTIASREGKSIKKVIELLDNEKKKGNIITMEDVRDCLLYCVLEKKLDATYTIVHSKLNGFMLRKRQGVAQTYQPFKSSQEKSLETMNNRNYNNLNQGAKSVYEQLETTIGGKRR